MCTSMSGEALLGQMRLQCRPELPQRSCRDQAHVNFRNSLARKNGLPTRPGVATDQAFNVDGWLRDEHIRWTLAIHVVNPMLAPLLPSWFRPRSNVSPPPRSLFVRLESGRFRANPSTTGVFPSGETRVASASTRCHAGTIDPRLIARVQSFFGPRPHSTAVDVSSSSTTPFAPRYT